MELFLVKQHTHTLAKEIVKSNYNLLWVMDNNFHNLFACYVKYFDFTFDFSGIRAIASDAKLIAAVNQYISDHVGDVANSTKFYGIPRIPVEIIGRSEVPGHSNNVVGLAFWHSVHV